MHQSLRFFSKTHRAECFHPISSYLLKKQTSPERYIRDTSKCPTLPYLGLQACTHFLEKLSEASTRNWTFLVRHSNILEKWASYFIPRKTKMLKWLSPFPMKVTVIRGAQHARPWEGIRHSAQALGTGIATAENNPWAQAKPKARLAWVFMDLWRKVCTQIRVNPLTVGLHNILLYSLLPTVKLCTSKKWQQ